MKRMIVNAKPDGLEMLGIAIHVFMAVPNVPFLNIVMSVERMGMRKMIVTVLLDGLTMKENVLSYVGRRCSTLCFFFFSFFSFLFFVITRKGGHRKLRRERN
jgi:hypothetical protein